MGKELPMLYLVAADDRSLAVEDDETGARSPLIEGSNEITHGALAPGRSVWCRLIAPAP
jgi:hypothetical protein